jgi:hypothetical protein
MARFTDEMHNTLLWTYSRGTWQYDLICALILGFIFIIPPSFFNRKMPHDKVDAVVQHTNQMSQTDAKQEGPEVELARPKAKP